MLGRVFMGRYQAVQLLGEGGMGKVYLARQIDLERQVVVKVMHDHVAADPTFRERFHRETKVMARFEHPFAVRLYDATFTEEQGSCIVMEYVRGITLDVLLQKNLKLDTVRVGRLLSQLCEVLQAAHNAGIIHRDLKPANLMVVDPDTPYEMIKVMDFGLAKLLGPDAQASITNAEFAVGTPGYMCPEQARGEEMDNRGDLYSVGVILFELLTGQLPFAGRSTMDVLLAHATEEPPCFTALGTSPGVPQAIEEVVQSCLAKSPDERPRDARDLADRYAAALASVAAAATAAAPTANGNGVRTSKRGGLLSRNSFTPIPPAENQGQRGSPGETIPPENNLATPPPPTVSRSPSSTTTPAFPPLDPLAIAHTLEAWMPETIAIYKLRGFIQDAGGELLESVPGRINVRLGGKNSVYTAPPRTWLGLTRRAPLIEVELRLQRVDKTRENQLRITVVFRSPGYDISVDTAWRDLCSRIFCDLRGYLMGQSPSLSDLL
jgi:eukaryotic-like serine/threonine-protein kinase